MRVVVQRVRSASVWIENVKHSEIASGMLVFIGIESDDSSADIEWLTNKISNLRIFPDEGGIMNKSILDVEGEVLVVSQFTLHASTKKGNRPSYIKAAKPEISIPLYEDFVNRLQQMITRPVQTGVFGATMEVRIVNDGPVTIIIDSKNRE